MMSGDALPKVSIIMPTWNRASLIMESIGSVRNQTYQNWQLIIVDDGSTDNTAELIAQIEDNRVQFHKAGKIGLGIRLKFIGIDKADGDLIAFIDSDDLWAPGKLEKQVAALMKYPEAGFSLTGGYNFREKDLPLEYFYKQREGSRYGDIFVAFFTSEAAILPPTMMFRKECLPVLRKLAAGNPASDVEFLLGLALQCKAVILYEPLFYRRLHDSGYSINNWERGAEEGLRLIKTFTGNGKLPVPIAQSALFRLHIHTGEKFIHANKKQKAIGHFLRAWKSSPFSIVPVKKMLKAILS